LRVVIDAGGMYERRLTKPQRGFYALNEPSPLA
jgi:hypothetical protein